jgi:TRAP-type C4-dicarboxylate transport system permease small subunit
MTTDNLLSSASIEMVDADEAGRRKVAHQWSRMSAGWRRVDAAIITGTQWLLCGVGALFAVMITLEVLSRYVFGFSIYFINAAARLLLVWFFMLGAGIAMRHGAHVGFELLLSALSTAGKRAVVVIGLVAAAAFSLEMLYAGIVALGPAWRQTEPGLDISLVWPILSIPVGFALLFYHILVIMWLATREKAA